MPPLFTKSLAESLDQVCPLPVCEAHDGQPLESGHVYIAPGGQQMKVTSIDGVKILRMTDDPPTSGCRPSVDYLFGSLVDLYGSRTLAVIMTGMGYDGTESLRLLKQRSAITIAQDEASCVVYGMPRKPVEEGLADIVAPLDTIAGYIMSHARRKTLACR